jgi:hypothetical protein
MGAAALDIGQLSRDEQLDLLDQLWQALGRDPRALPLRACLAAIPRAVTREPDRQELRLRLSGRQELRLRLSGR